MPSRYEGEGAFKRVFTVLQENKSNDNRIQITIYPQVDHDEPSTHSTPGTSTVITPITSSIVTSEVDVAVLRAKSSSELYPVASVFIQHSLISDNKTRMLTNTTRPGPRALNDNRFEMIDTNKNERIEAN